MLGPTPRTSDDNSFEPSDELLRRRLLYERGIQHLRALYLRAGDEPAQVLLYGLDFRQLGHGLVIPIFHVFLRRFLGSEGRVAFFEWQVAVRTHRPNPEASTFELRGQLRRIIQPHPMDLVEDEYTARSQGVVDAPENATEAQVLVLRVE